MFNFFKNKVSNIYNKFTNKLASIFNSNKLDDEFLDRLKILLLSADTGISTTNKIISALKAKIDNKNVQTMEELKESLKKILIEILNKNKSQFPDKGLILLVGINGTGKTTFAAKLADRLKKQNKKVLLVAGDTFRAAAVDQLASWANKLDINIFLPSKKSDPASVVFDAVTSYVNQNYDYAIIDTAGRLQNKANLMRELDKIVRVIKKVAPSEKIYSLLTIDAMLGQNSFEQAKVFKESINVNGVVLTKLDGTGKGGIVFSVSEKLNLPIKFITYGEKISDLSEFDSKQFVDDLIEK